MERWTMLPEGLGVRCEVLDCDEPATCKIHVVTAEFIGCRKHAEEFAKLAYKTAKMRS